jgi:hypothetical protein
VDHVPTHAFAAASAGGGFPESTDVPPESFPESKGAPPESTVALPPAEVLFVLPCAFDVPELVAAFVLEPLPELARPPLALD